MPVDDPARNAATQLADLLRARGVDVGSPDTGTAPADAVEIAQVTSPPLKAIVASMLSSSDNLTAELLTKELGVHAAKAGTTAAGVAATTAKLKELGVPIADGALKDGSGLDRGNRVTCANLVATLGLADRPGLATLYDGLPVAGQNGTLYDQFLGTALAGNFRGKTGSLDGVSGLTGVLDLGRRMRFAFLDNGDVLRGAGRGHPRQRSATSSGASPTRPRSTLSCPRRSRVWFSMEPDAAGRRPARHPADTTAAAVAAAAPASRTVGAEAPAAAAAARHRAARPRRHVLQAADARPAAEARPLHRLRRSSARCCSASASCSSACRACGRCRTRPATRSPATGRGCPT